MDISIGDSGMISRIVKESLSKVFGEEEGAKLYEALYFREIKTNRLLHSVNELIIKTQHSDKLKDLLERIVEGLSSRVDVKPSVGELSVKKGGSTDVVINVTNRFDIPLLFDVALEDRDSFLPIVYNKIEGAYFNGFSMESVIDAGSSGNFKFKVGYEKENEGTTTTLFIVVRSSDVEGLNRIEKLRVAFV
ncbi:hypothetical protein M1293_00785 [Candidatus Parvarchaeota archaeon]|nr:hypothetical protein [Candidatus Parvarchaeota archaeon]